MRRLADQWAMLGRIFAFIGLLGILSGLFHAVGTVWMMAAGSVETMGIYAEDEQEGQYIQYEADGQLYRIECALGGQPGTQAAVRYLIDDPGTARMTDPEKWGLSVFSGAVFFAVGMAFMSVMIRNKRLRRSLFKDGLCVQAQIDEIECESLPPKWRKRYRIIASMKHPGTGRWVKVSSGWLMDHPGKYLTDGTVTVLADKADENRYYMKLERGEMTGYQKTKVNDRYWGNR